MNNNLPHHLLPSLFLTSLRSLQCSERGRNGTCPPVSVCCEVVAGSEGGRSSCVPLNITVDRKQMDKCRVRKEKLLLLPRGRQLPVLLQQSGSTPLFFQFFGTGLIMLNCPRWQKYGEVMYVDRLLMGICIPAFTEDHAKFQHRSFLLPSAHL